MRNFNGRWQEGFKYKPHIIRYATPRAYPRDLLRWQTTGAEPVLNRDNPQLLQWTRRLSRVPPLLPKLPLSKPPVPGEQLINVQHARRARRVKKLTWMGLGLIRTQKRLPVFPHPIQR